MSAFMNDACSTPRKRESHSAEDSSRLVRVLPPLLLQRGRRVALKGKRKRQFKSTTLFPPLLKLTFGIASSNWPAMRIDSLLPAERAWIRLMGNPYAVLALIEEADDEEDSKKPSP